MGDSSDDFRTADVWRRPQTEELVDVHVYVVPSNEWIEQRRLAKKDIIDQAISSGFVRVLPSTTLLELRGDIIEQLGAENVPEVYVFLRSVGRNFTQVKSKQELELKVKSFLPPCAEEPEVYVKEGEYTFVRSASVGIVSQNTQLNSSASHTARSTSSGSPAEESSLSTDTDRRAQSLERRTPMSALKTVPPQQSHRRTKNTRPPTPRVKERTFNKFSRYRSSSISSTKMKEAIRESPTEQIEEHGPSNESLDVKKNPERILNSPPPRPQSKTEQKNSDVRIPVPTPTPSPRPDPGKSIQDTHLALHNTDSNSFPETTADVVADVGNELSEQNGDDRSEENLPNDGPSIINEPIPTEREDVSQETTMFEDMHSKMDDEDVIEDPIKLLQGEGDSAKNAEDNGRDHYDEGFHSGELVASEEDSNSIETLGSCAVKDEEQLSRPVRAATPMPRSSSFYKSGDPEIEKLGSKVEDIKAERRLRELKRDALMQKVRDLQKRKASSKDQAREEWRRRFQEMKKVTPRLEDHCSTLRQELEKLVKDMLVSVRTDPDSKPHKPSKKTSYKIMIMRHLQEVEDLKRRLQSVTIKLNAETKLRSQAEFEVKKLRQDLLHKKTQVTLTRKQTAFPQASEMFFISAV